MIDSIEIFKSTGQHSRNIPDTDVYNMKKFLQAISEELFHSDRRMDGQMKANTHKTYSNVRAIIHVISSLL